MKWQKVNNTIVLKSNLVNDEERREDQKSLVLPQYDATQMNKVTEEFVFMMAQEVPVTTDPQSKQLFPRIKKRQKKGRNMVRYTRAKIPQNTLVLDGGTTVHLISSLDMNYRCYIPTTKHTRVSNTAMFYPHCCNLPLSTPIVQLTMVIQDLATVLNNPIP